MTGLVDNGHPPAILAPMLYRYGIDTDYDIKHRYILCKKQIIHKIYNTIVSAFSREFSLLLLLAIFFTSYALDYFITELLKFND